MKGVHQSVNCKLALVSIMFLAAIFSVNADFNIGGAYSYLASKSSNGSYNSNIIDTSLALMAFGAVGKDVSKEIAYLRSQENEQKCWPRQSCTIKDTSFASIALSLMGLDTESEKGWLEKSQSSATLTGAWYLEIATSETGSCRLSYELNNNSVEKEVKVVKGVFPECGNSTFYNINKCLAQGIVSSMPSLELDVNCDALASIESMTILYQTGNSYYLVDEEQTSRARLMIKNGCFGSVRRFRARLFFPTFEFNQKTS